MSEMEMLDEPVTVETVSDSQGQVAVQRLKWREQAYTVISMGRQWDEPAGRHLLVETAGGTRFELELRREDLRWRVRRVWWGQTLA